MKARTEKRLGLSFSGLDRHKSFLNLLQQDLIRALVNKIPNRIHDQSVPGVCHYDS